MTMKRLMLVCVMMLLVCLCLSGCNLSAIMKPIPAGYINKDEHFDPNGFQDYTDYCKYQYASAEPFRRDTRYHVITEDEKDDIYGYFVNFRGWMATAERLDEYDFSPTCISVGDYVLIETKEGQPIGSGGRQYGKYDNYSVYFFDTESLTLYYIHNNI